MSLRQSGVHNRVISVPPPLTQSVQLQAQHIFLQDTIVLTPYSSGVSRGHFAKLASLLESSLASSALYEAVNAVALVSLATRFSIPEIRPLAAAQYASSIRHIRAQIIASMHKDSVDYLLASISLLSLYEVCSTSLETAVDLSLLNSLHRGMYRFSMQM
jgi:hypothetical protein